MDKSKRTRLEKKGWKVGSVAEFLGLTPDEQTALDAQYRQFVRDKIEQGLADVEAGRVIPHDEAKRRMQKWLSE